MDNEVSGKLHQYVQHIKDRIDGNFTGFDTMLEEEENQIFGLEEKHQIIEEKMSFLKHRLEKEIEAL